jgi:hypothetical protein
MMPGLVNRPDKKMGIVLLDHLGFEPLPKLRFPAIVAILPVPLSVFLPHFPIGAHHRVAATARLATKIVIAEIEVLGLGFSKKIERTQSRSASM